MHWRVTDTVRVRPRFSVVIPVRDRADVVGRAVASVLAQTFADVEVVVVDDGSTDDSVAAARAVSDGRVRIVAQNAAGPAAARRSGVERAHGRWIALLDPDDEVAPGWLARLGRLVDATDAVLVSCGGEQLHDDGSSTTIGPAPLRAGRTTDPRNAPVLACFRPGAFAVRRDLLLADGVMHLATFDGADDPDPDPDPGHGDSLVAVGSRLVAHIDRLGLQIAATPEPLVRWNAPPAEATPEGEQLRLRWALQSLDASSRTPIPDAELLVRSATVGAIAAVRLGDHHEARRLFRLARKVTPESPRLWARWLVSCVPPLASRVWAPVEPSPGAGEGPCADEGTVEAGEGPGEEHSTANAGIAVLRTASAGAEVDN